jgi:hypothetical protein
MPKLAKHMFETDLDGQWENGDQRVITYTIGFLTDQDLLSDVRPSSAAAPITPPITPTNSRMPSRRP